MKAFLMYPDQDFAPELLPLSSSPWRQERKKPVLSAHEQALIQDLELNTLLQAMALGDDFVYEFARGFYDQGMANAFFLRAERKADGRRTFKLIAGEPLQTSYGADLYKMVFGTAVNQLATAYLQENSK